MLCIRLRFAGVVLLCASAVHCPAADRFFVGPSGSDWNDPDNWSTTSGGAGGASVPGNGDLADLRRTSIAFGTKTVQFNKIYTAGNELERVIVGDSGIGLYRVDQELYVTSIGGLNIINSPVLRTETLSVVSGGRWNQSAGSTFISADLFVSGVYTLSGGLVQGPFFGSIGWHGGTGVVNHSGGTLDTNGTVVLGSYGGNATYNLSGTGTLKIGLLYVSGLEQGDGVINHTAGNATFGTIQLGYGDPPTEEQTADGTYNFAGGSLTVNNQLNVGAINNTSLFKQTGGDAVVEELNIRNYGSLSPASYLLQGGSLEVNNVTNSKTFSHTAGTLRVLGTFNNSGTATFGATQEWSPSSALNATAASTTTFNSNAGSNNAFNLAVSSISTAKVNFNASQNLRRLSISDGSKAELAPSPNGDRYLNLRQLAIEGGPIPANLDLNNNGMIVDKTLTSLSVIRANLVRGYNAGNWNGAGIMSAFAADDPSNETALGYVDNAAHTYGTFLGQHVNGNSILVLYTIYGDVNLDRQVGFLDLLTVAANFGKTGAHWFHGDFDFDEKVGFADLLRVAANFGGAFPASVAGASEEFNQAMQQIPEPASGLLLIAMLVALHRRR